MWVNCWEETKAIYWAIELDGFTKWRGGREGRDSGRMECVLCPVDGTELLLLSWQSLAVLIGVCDSGMRFGD